MPNYTPDAMATFITTVVAKIAKHIEPTEDMNLLLQCGDLGDAWMFTAGCINMVGRSMATQCECGDPSCQAIAEPALARLDEKGEVIGIDLLSDGVPEGVPAGMVAYTRMLAADISQDMTLSMEVFIAECDAGGLIPLMRTCMREAAQVFRATVAAQQ